MLTPPKKVTQKGARAGASAPQLGACDEAG